MERLTKKSKNSDMVWFVDHENNNAILEPCEMNSHHDRLVVQKLAAYEDAEEQGLLIRLPCKEGCKLYDVRQGNIQHRKNNMVHELEIGCVNVKFAPWETWCATDVSLNEIGKTVFLTREEAEAALERMNKGK